jgi:hypothetical protein
MASKRLAIAAVAAAALVVGVAAALADDGNGQQKGAARYTIGLIGDVPYNAQGKADYPYLLQDINDSRVAFTVFDGDLKSGGDGGCVDSLYTTAISNFNSLERPLVWVPGDNDWTDCWGRYGPGAAPFFDPLERLAHERQLFASTSKSLGRKTLALTRQSSEGYPENVRWTLGPIVYLGLNVQGSNDNYPYHDTDGPARSDAEIQRMRDEQAARKAANLHWLDEGFQYAKQTHAKGVMIVWQADPNFNNENKPANPHEYDAYPDYVNALRSQTLAFPGQVVLVHGDAHYFKIDKPLTLPSGKVLPNFTRVETFGAASTHWVQATIDPKSRNLFLFEPMIVPATATS